MPNINPPAEFVVGLPEAHDPGGKVRIPVPEHWESSAEFSPCGRYRYKLVRVFNRYNKIRVLMICMNGSIANLTVNDPTNARCCAFTQSWGAGGLLLGNVCGYLATDKRRLLEVEDPVGPRNHAAILEMAERCDKVVMAFGKLPGKLQRYADNVVDLLLSAGYPLYALALSKDGTPKHPLYLKSELKPFLWRKPNA